MVRLDGVSQTGWREVGGEATRPELVKVSKHGA